MARDGEVMCMVGSVVEDIAITGGDGRGDVGGGETGGRGMGQDVGRGDLPRGGEGGAWKSSAKREPFRRISGLGESDFSGVERVIGSGVGGE